MSNNSGIVRTTELGNALTWTIVQWADIAIKEFHRSMVKAGVKRSHLWRSLTYNIKYDNGFPVEVSIGFLYHGRFVDMGVGRGVRISDVKNNAELWRAATIGKKRKDAAALRGRRPKKWYAKTAYIQFQILSDILLSKYRISTSRIVENNIKTAIEIIL